MCQFEVRALYMSYEKKIRTFSRFGWIQAWSDLFWTRQNQDRNLCQKETENSMKGEVSNILDYPILRAKEQKVEYFKMQESS